MKHLKTGALVVISVLFLMVASLYSAQSAKAIMLKYDEVSRDSYSSSIAKTKLSTCKYKIKNNRMQCGERPRVTILENISKDYGKHKRDTRAVAIVLEPISDKGIGVLTYEYYDSDKENDLWMYFSALGKVKRLISNSEDSGSGSFFGSEFTAEDMQSRKVEEYTYRIIKEVTYNKREAWVVESIPTAKKAKKTQYSKTLSWIDKERFITLKQEYFNRHGKVFKKRTYKKIERIDNVWVARLVIMNNIDTRRVSHLELSSVAFNIPVSDDFLTQRALTDFAFRERNLAKYRKYFN